MSLTLVSLAVVLFAGEAAAQTECGTYFSQPRIVGGNKTGYYKYPWHAMTTRYGYPVCGGTLITSTHILTAAHCYDAYNGTPNTQKYKYVLGTYNRCKYESTSKIFSASAVTIHPNYDRRTTKNDVAIVRLSTAATGFAPACLPPSVSYTARIGLIMGYGTTVPGNSSSSPCELNEAQVTIFTRQEALATSLPQSVALMEGTFAAGKINGSGVDTCQGDSGGPMVTMNQGKYIATGITSFGYGCAEPNYPGIYANVSYYLPFIRNIIGQSG